MSASTTTTQIDVCICTYKRPEMLAKLLDSLSLQQTNGGITFSINVADNDEIRSAEPIVTCFARRSPIPTYYLSEPRKNISLARNRAVLHGNGDFVAFIDDDEFPANDWLVTMLTTCERLNAAGVLGPVRPHFESPPPRWITRGGLCARPEHPTGTRLNWEESRTGNVLLRREVLRSSPLPFDPQFGSGGEDNDFFRRMNQAGHIFCWCNEGVVYETVPPSRWKRRYMLRQALLRGRIVLKHPTARHSRLLMASLLAVSVYPIILFLTVIFRHDLFMKYCIKLFDHIGRLLAFLRLNPIEHR